MTRISTPSDSTIREQAPDAVRSDQQACDTPDEAQRAPIERTAGPGVDHGSEPAQFIGRGFAPHHRGALRLSAPTELEGVVAALQLCHHSVNSLEARAQQLSALIEALHRLANGPFGDDREAVLAQAHRL